MPVDLNKPLKRVNGVIVPQYWNEDIQDWEIVEGSGGAYKMQTQTKVSRSPFFGSSTMTKEFSDVMSFFVISNDGNADLTFTVNDGDGAGDTYKVYAGAVWGDDLPPFTSITITTTVPFQAYGKLATGSIVAIPPVPDTTAPDNATNLVTSAVTATSLTLTWTASASSDCTGYDIYRGATFLTTVTGTTYNATGLTQATQYTFSVKAKDAVPNIASGVSTTVTTASSSDTTPPANVTNLTTSNITQSGLTLNWTGSVSGDVASYDIYNGSSFIANVTAPTTTYNVNGLSPSTPYTLWVRAKDASGNSASGTSVDATTSAPPADTTAPSNVTNLATSAINQTGVTLNWTAATDNVAVTGYDIYNGASLVTTVTATTYNATGLTASTQYTYTVKAKDAAGNASSGTSVTFTTSAVSDTTPPNPVTGLSAGTPTSSTVPLSWTLSSSGDVAAYEAAYSTDGTNFTVASAVINAASNTYTVGSLTANTPYNFRLVAIDTSNNRSTAVTTTATTAAASTGTIVASDDFNRADGALGNAVTGQTWTVGTGNVATIISNQAGALASSSNYPNLAITQSDNIDIELDMTLPTLVTGSISGVSARVSAGNNQALIFGALTNGTKAGFLTTLSGGSTVPANVSFTFVAGQTYHLKLEVRGNVYKGYIDGVLIQTYTDSANVGLTSVKHGFVFYSTNVPRGDNFKITSF